MRHNQRIGGEENGCPILVVVQRLYMEAAGGVHSFTHHVVAGAHLPDAVASLALEGCCHWVQPPSR